MKNVRQVPPCSLQTLQVVDEDHGITGLAGGLLDFVVRPTGRTSKVTGKDLEILDVKYHIIQL